MKKGHIPIRQCIGCRRRRPAREMILLKSIGDTVVVSHSKDKIPGRGCYTCPTWECAKSALRKERLSRALRNNILRFPSPEELLTGLDEKRWLDDQFDR
ncbi:MAG: YlxR family protein [Desulfomonilaceae bacterium]